MESETVPTAGWPNLMPNYLLPSVVERLDLAKPCPHSVNGDRKFYSDTAWRDWNPDQVLGVAAGILRRQASDGASCRSQRGRRAEI
jgi:hypothetical protein